MAGKFVNGFGTVSHIIALALVISLVTVFISQSSAKSGKEITGSGGIYGKVAVILNNGDVKPIAKRTFYLLPFPFFPMFIKLYKEAESVYGEGPSYSENPEQHDAHHQKMKSYRATKVKDAIEEAKRAGKFFQFVSEFDGSYKIRNVPAGQYYICNAPTETQGAVVTLGRVSIAWSVPIRIQPGKNLKIDLSNDNAADIQNY